MNLSDMLADQLSQINIMHTYLCVIFQKIDSKQFYLTECQTDDISHNDKLSSVF
jgi:hypothetical protein